MPININDLSENEKTILSEYLMNHFIGRISERDDSFLEIWRDIISMAEENGAAWAINNSIAARRPVDFKNPKGIRIYIYESFAGAIPIIELDDTDDFESLVTNVIHRGEKPKNIGSTGASFAFGKTTRFIILSSKPYSNVPAAELSIDASDWMRKSMILRREHECNHYFTRWMYGEARNHLHDELMADFFGIYEAFGYYKAEYFLKFMGVIKGSGDRLKVYIPDMSEELYEVLCQIAKRAAEYLEAWSESPEFAQKSRIERAKWLCELNLADFC